MAVSGIEQRKLGDGTILLHPQTGEALFKPSNVSTLFDTNGDGIPDTGPLAPGQTYTVAVRVIIPIDAVSQIPTPGYADNDGRGRMPSGNSTLVQPDLTSKYQEKSWHWAISWTQRDRRGRQIYVGAKSLYQYVARGRAGL